jgi:pyrroloquinoline quinone biosynthesis protein E
MSHVYPFGILAELTYGCPLHCPYCSNPLDLGNRRDELSTAEWERILAEGAELGALQAHLSGGEPLLRRDVTQIVRAASAAGLYTNQRPRAVPAPRAAAA